MLKAYKPKQNKSKLSLKLWINGYLNEYGGRILAEKATAQEAFKRAISVGDPDATLEAQKKLTSNFSFPSLN